MKTTLTAATVATLTLSAVGPTPVDSLYDADTRATAPTRPRETRHQRDERLREAQRHLHRGPREARYEREERLREADWML